MYQLYFSPNACSLATQVVLRELNLPFELVNVANLADFSAVNPVGAVPALKDMQSNQVKTEGVSILLELLQQHSSQLWPESVAEQSQAVQNMLFANATVHPAYSKLFFVMKADVDEAIRVNLYQQGAASVAKLWQVVEQKLANQAYLGGDQVSVADILLAVYSRWNAFFPVDIEIGLKAQNMLDNVLSLPSFQASLAAEKAHS